GALGLELGQVGLELLRAGVDVGVTLLLDVRLVDADLALDRREITVTTVFVDLGDHVRREVDDLFQILRGQVEQVTEPARHTFEVPDVRDRSGKLAAAHALAAAPRAGHLDAATLADAALDTNALVPPPVTPPLAGPPGAHIA